MHWARMMWLDKRAIQTQAWESRVWGAMPTPDLTHGTRPHQHPEVDGSADGALHLSPGSWTQMTLQGRFQDIILFQNLVSFKADLKEKGKNVGEREIGPFGRLCSNKHTLTWNVGYADPNVLKTWEVGRRTVMGLGLIICSKGCAEGKGDPW